MNRSRVLLSMAVGLLCVLATGIAVSATGAATSATFMVDDPVDRVDDDTADGQCLTALNTCSLRAAIQQANATGGADTIILPSGTYSLTIGGSGDNTAATGDLDILGDLTLTGAGAAVTVIDASHLDRVFHITGTVQVTISGVTIRNGNDNGFSGGGVFINKGVLTLADAIVTNNYSSASGGGVSNQGTLTLTNTSLISNSSFSGGGLINSGALKIVGGQLISNSAVFGGGLSNGGTATMQNVTLSANVATNGSSDGRGGGIYSSGDLQLTDVTLSDNFANAQGGGLEISWATLNRVTISGNRSGAFGGGIFHNGGTATLTNTTISNNVIDSVGGGIYNNAGTMNLTNATLFSNTANFTGTAIYNAATMNLKNTTVARSLSGPNCAGAPLASLGHNLDSGSNCGLFASGDISNTNPLLGPLQDNAGATFTHALIAGSPAIDAGDNVGCPAVDQRGALRPIGSACDIGAYEYGFLIYLPVVLRNSP